VAQDHEGDGGVGQRGDERAHPEAQQVAQGPGLQVEGAGQGEDERARQGGQDHGDDEALAQGLAVAGDPQRQPEQAEMQQVRELREQAGEGAGIGPLRPGPGKQEGGEREGEVATEGGEAERHQGLGEGQAFAAHRQGDAAHGEGRQRLQGREQDENLQGIHAGAVAPVGSWPV
jgi:hypothetical protein